MDARVRYISRKDIDTDAWDRCIAGAENGLIYAHVNYLDAMCDYWDAVICTNYDAVMPIPYRKKFGIKYSYHPAFIQQLGIIGNISNQVEKDMLQVALQKIHYGDFLFNYENAFVTAIVNAKTCTNLVLPLHNQFENIESLFTKDAVSNIRRATRLNLKYLTEEDLPFTIEVFRRQYGERFPHITNSDYENFKKLSVQLAQSGKAFARKVLNEENEVIATALFLVDERRIYNVANTTSDHGRDLEANYYMIEGLVKEFSGKQLLLDFEGSDLPGVRAFYEKFGAIEQPYFHYIHDRLPRFMKWLVNRRF